MSARSHSGTLFPEHSRPLIPPHPNRHAHSSSPPETNPKVLPALLPMLSSQRHPITPIPVTLRRPACPSPSSLLSNGTPAHTPTITASGEATAVDFRPRRHPTTSDGLLGDDWSSQPRPRQHGTRPLYIEFPPPSAGSIHAQHALPPLPAGKLVLHSVSPAGVQKCPRTPQTPGRIGSLSPPLPSKAEPSSSRNKPSPTKRKPISCPSCLSWPFIRPSSECAS